MKFYEIFSRLCNERGESPNAVCAKIGLSNSTYSFWKKEGNTPRETTLYKIAEYFSVPLSLLTGEENEEEYVSRVVGLVVEWLTDNDYEYDEEDNDTVTIGKDGNYAYFNKSDFAIECMAIKKVSEDGFELAMLDWERRNLNVNIDNSSHDIISDSKNVINDSPNATLIANEENLSKQEKELINMYREFSLEEQLKLISYAISLSNKE